jgi:glyoxylate reductase
MRALVTQPIAASALEALQTVGEVTVWPGPYPIPPEALAKELAQVDGVLTMLTDRVDADLLARAPNLLAVANMAVGYDNIDVEAATRAGVWVTHTPDVLTEATAQLTWALILALTRGLIPAREALLAGEWRYWSPDGFLGRELTGKTLGIVGWGRIGRAVGAKAPAFGMRVVALGTKAAGDVERLDPDVFWAAADVVSLHAPLTPSTVGMVGRDQLGRMRPGSYLVNTARGPLVDEAALLWALDYGPLAGAALDVFAEEPVDGRRPLVRHPRVLATPHIGSATVETRERMAMMAAQDLARMLAGDAPLHPVNHPPSLRRA